MDEIRERLKETRRLRGISRRILSCLTGFHEMTISCVERNGKASEDTKRLVETTLNRVDILDLMVIHDRNKECYIVSYRDLDDARMPRVFRQIPYGYFGKMDELGWELGLRIEEGAGNGEDHAR